MTEQPTGPDLEFAHIEYITGSPDIQSKLVVEKVGTIDISDISRTEIVDSQMLNSLRFYKGVLQCRVKVQEIDEYGDPLWPAMWEWHDVKVAV